MCIITHMRKFFVVLILFLGVAFVILSFGELEKIAETLKQGNLWFLALAFAIEMGWLVVLGLGLIFMTSK